MKLKIELDADYDKDTYNFIMSKIKGGNHYLQLDPLNTGVVGWFAIYAVTQDRDISFHRYSTILTLEVQSCHAPKSKEQLAAENAVVKAKEALKAAEESLKLVSGK